MTMVWNGTDPLKTNITVNHFSFDGDNITIQSNSGNAVSFDILALTYDKCTGEFSSITVNENYFKVNTLFNHMDSSDFCLIPYKNKYATSLVSSTNPSANTYVYSNGTYIQFNKELIQPINPYHLLLNSTQPGMSWTIEGNMSSRVNPFDYICDIQKGSKYSDGRLVPMGSYQNLIQCSGSQPNYILRYTALTILGVAMIILIIFLIWKTVKCIKDHPRAHNSNSVYQSNDPISVNLNEPLVNTPVENYVDDQDKKVVYFKRKANQ
ncbi:hypothetical protein TVAG_180600 [Trichomonas vaginalis G3]|uniref:Uncharacterized protein n=1 Tax=Trichomonas vaginalis (strain ATCC PRA-98 / G3) TaxID=412133 RepID=A2EE88_TRIV3|nr:hypothetical protein TVAGG3_0614010 [Trichomonas vaginalis G3]EAY09085.1 hypothetical protein TVAG_180600 [Trichomonas vaginalis G3]KAI5503400.1 hypothetical protein TVAGG3_0614010 [Trichomonas vaginalis G3]|eukprot:XP_001321308.1 hypothetical protein [Trichomonas vaginalis G3]